jgi:hypothetical protein
MNDDSHSHINDRTIRFIDNEYNLIFSIPDRGYVTITLPTGEQKTQRCLWRGEHHFQIEGHIYHDRWFAVTMKRCEINCSPCLKPETARFAVTVTDASDKKGEYLVTRRMPTTDRHIVLGQNLDIKERWATWLCRSGAVGIELVNFYSNASEAQRDYNRLAIAAVPLEERRGLSKGERP